MIYQIYPITPVPKPRMTRGDRHQKRPRGDHYRAFVQECELRGVSVVAGDHVYFYMPMPPSWSGAKKARLNYQPCLSTPDVDNLTKALLDAVYDDDSAVWSIHASKAWHYTGAILIVRHGPPQIPILEDIAA